MSIRLTSDSQFTIGTGHFQVDLVSVSTGARLSLTADEAAVASMLVSGAHDEVDLYRTIRKHGMDWEPTVLTSFLYRLESNGFLQRTGPEEQPLPAAHRPDDDVPRALDFQFGLGQEAAAAPSPPRFRSILVTRRLADGSVELRDPGSPQWRERLSASAFQLARMFNGQRTAEEVATLAKQAGLSVELADLLSLIDELMTRDILQPEFGHRELIVPLNQPPLQAESEARDSLESLVQEQREATSPEAPDSKLQPVETLLSVAEDMAREGQPHQARTTLRLIQQLDPTNRAAQSLLDRLGEEPEQTSLARRRRRRRIAGAGVLTLLGAVVIAFSLIRISQRVDLPCRASLIPLASVTSTIAGVVDRVPISRGQIVKQDQLLVRLVDRESRQRKAALADQIASDTELLRIMKTSCSRGDEERLKQMLARHASERKQVKESCGEDSTCEGRLQELETQIERARTKLKYCEWEARPREIAALRSRVDAARKALEDLSSRAQEEDIFSPANGLVAKAVSPGSRVDSEQQVARLVDPGRIRIETESGGQNLPRTGQPATIRLRGPNYTAILRGRVQRVLQLKRIRIDIDADPTTIRIESRCTAELELGRQSLGRWLLDRMR